MGQLAGVLLQMYSLDPHCVRLAVIALDFKVAVLTKGLFILGDLISLREIRIKVILTGEAGECVNGAVKG